MNAFFERIFNPTYKRYIIIVSSSLLVVLLIILGCLVSRTLKYDKIYKGVYINHINVSSLTPKEAKELLEKTYLPSINSMNINLTLGSNIETSTQPSTILKPVDFDKAVEKAYSEGRTGNSFIRIFNISLDSLRGKNLPIQYDFDESKLQQLIGKFYLKIQKDLVENSYKILSDKIVINFGQAGQTVDESGLRQKLIEKISSLQSGDLEIPILITPTTPINLEQVHQAVYSQVKDAKYIIDNNRLSFVDEVVGKDFNVEKAKEAINQNYKEMAALEIPLDITLPKVFVKDLKRTIFRDKLSEFSTRYGLRDRNRSENVRLAASKIDEFVLPPGEVFSYNNTVGKRTIEEGFKKAHVYLKGKIIDGIGGGICQVSTTLYNSVLFANLEVVKRQNHNMIVAYVPPGRDATVSYGGPDFQFKNNLQDPVKISASTYRGRLNIQIWGTNLNSDTKVQLETQILRSFSLPQKTIQNPSKPVGYSRVVEKGLRGYVASTYKIIRARGKVISREKISTNHYNALARVVEVGTKKPVEKKPAEAEPKDPPM
jgi:vancomycin resistance protein YoaR